MALIEPMKAREIPPSAGSPLGSFHWAYGDRHISLHVEFWQCPDTSEIELWFRA